MKDQSVFFAWLICFAFLSVSGCAKDKAPEKQNDDAQAGNPKMVGGEQPKDAPLAKPVDRLAGRKVDITIDAYDLLVEDAKGTAPFDGKVIELSGVVVALRQNGDKNEIQVGNSDSGEKVRCMVYGLQPWSVLGKGQEVTVKGRFTGQSFNPMLEDAVIVSKGKPTTTTITAEKLADEIDAEKGELKKHDKPFIISGEVLRIGEKKDAIYLKGNSKNTVECLFVEFDNQMRVGRLAVGDKVNLYGQFLYSSKGVITLGVCQFIDQ